MEYRSVVDINSFKLSYLSHGVAWRWENGRGGLNPLFVEPSEIAEHEFGFKSDLLEKSPPPSLENQVALVIDQIKREEIYLVEKADMTLLDSGRFYGSGVTLKLAIQHDSLPETVVSETHYTEDERFQEIISQEIADDDLKQDILIHYC